MFNAGRKSKIERDTCALATKLYGHSNQGQPFWCLPTHGKEEEGMRPRSTFFGAVINMWVFGRKEGCIGLNEVKNSGEAKHTKGRLFELLSLPDLLSLQRAPGQHPHSRADPLEPSDAAISSKSTHVFFDFKGNQN